MEDFTASADPVQPDAGQGGAGTTEAPYGEYLNRIPEEVRGSVEPIFKEWDSNVTRRFQEHADFRKAWEPFEQAGISRYPAETVQWALQVLQDPQQAREWLDQTYGPVAQPESQQTQPPVSDTFGFEDPSQQFQSLLEQKLGPIAKQLEQFQQRFEQQDTQARETEARQFMDGQLSELKQKHPDAFKDAGPYGAEKMIERFVAAYIETDPMNAIPRAFDDYQKFVGQMQTQALQAKVDQPAPAEAGGAVALESGGPKTLEEAKKLALQQLRAERAA